jgi:hypothetical protein
MPGRAVPNRVVLVAALAAVGAAPAVGAPRGDPGTIITVLGGTISVEFEPGHIDVSRPEMMAWVSAAAAAVTAYFERFPVASFKVVIEPVPGKAGVITGTTWAEGGAHTRVYVGEHTTVADLARDWVMTHEMVHTAFPDQPYAHRWIEEGISTYVEPLARSWVGHYPAAKVWTDLVGQLPNGLPAAGDRGLDHTHTWGRTYWGVRCSVSSPIPRSAPAPTARAAWSMRCAGSSPPVATIRWTGRSSARFARVTRRSASRYCRSSTRR